MKKTRFSVLAGVILSAIIVVIHIIGVVQNSIRKPDENTLIFEGDSQTEVWIDIVIQGEHGVMYLGNMLLKDSSPTIQNVVDTINNSDKKILIGIDNSGSITSVNEYCNQETRHWNIYINNRKSSSNSIDVISVNDRDGITLIFE